LEKQKMEFAKAGFEEIWKSNAFWWADQ